MGRQKKTVAMSLGRWSTCSCHNCAAPNCGACINCRGKRAFGGTGRNHQRCENRMCLTLHPSAPVYNHNNVCGPVTKTTAATVTAVAAAATSAAHDSATNTASTSTPSAANVQPAKRKRDAHTLGLRVSEAPLMQPPNKRSKKTASSEASATSISTTSTGGTGSDGGMQQAKRNRCMHCPGCLAEDCRECIHCKGKLKYGGEGKDHTACILRLCHVLYPKVTETGRTRNRSSTAAAAAITSSSVTLCRKNKNTNAEPSVKKRRQRSSSFGGSEGGSVNHSDASSSNSVNPDDDEDKQRRNEPTTSNEAGNSLGGKKPRARVRPASRDTTTTTRPKQNCSTTASETPSVDVPLNDGADVFTLTSYLAQASVKPPHLAQATYVKSPHNNRKPPPPPTTLYGLDIPKEPAQNSCSGCLGARDEELDDHPVLLCDGPNCGREYHLVCCVPAITEVPDVASWLCRDCCPDGSTALLVQYLEAADKAKADYLSLEGPNVDYIQHLLHNDSLEANTSTDRIPESELGRSAMTHSLALCDSKRLARTRGGNEKREALSPESYLGKPIRIYNFIANMYHTGRIVEYRNQSKESSDAAAPDITEFLVRFAAGKDDRKKAYQHWIVLEEHALAVGSTMVWAQIPAGSWKPAILWLRTSRELVPVQNMLKESEGEIIFRGEIPSKTKHKVCALARSFGEEVFSLVNVRDQSVDLNEPAATSAYLRDPENVLQFHMAQAELAEQERVRSWRALQQVNPVGQAVLSSRDVYTLPPLIPTIPGSVPAKLNASLCSSVPRGLDRTKILKMLQIRGIQPTKDMAASLSCEIVPVNARTLDAERVGRTSHQ